MLQLTKRTEYGLIALTNLAAHAGSYVSVRELCERFPVPRRLVGEALKDLCRAGLVESQRGPNGGYALARPADAITVGDIVGALEGRPSLASCQSPVAYRSGACEVEEVCPIKSPIERLRSGIWAFLARTTLDDLVRRSAPLAAPSPVSASLG